MPKRDVIQSLTRFTPTPAGFDRDTLLFNAGRASVRRRWWLLPVVALLVVTQAFTLIALWPRRTTTPTPPSVTTPTPVLFEPREPSPVPPNSLAQLTQYIRTDGELPPTTSGGDWKPDHAPLTASSRGLRD